MVVIMHFRITLRLGSMPINHSYRFDFVITRFFMKLFRTNSSETVKNCQDDFNFQITCVLRSQGIIKFGCKYDLFIGNLHIP